MSTYVALAASVLASARVAVSADACLYVCVCVSARRQRSGDTTVVAPQEVSVPSGAPAEERRHCGAT